MADSAVNVYDEAVAQSMGIASRCTQEDGPTVCRRFEELAQPPGSDLIGLYVLAGAAVALALLWRFVFRGYPQRVRRVLQLLAVALLWGGSVLAWAFVTGANMSAAQALVLIFWPLVLAAVARAWWRRRRA